MLKWISLLALVGGLQAHANDGGIVLLDVRGLAPGANTLANTEVKLYGEDTKRLANVLPVTDVMGGRSVTMASDNYAATIYCQKDYDRPTTGVAESDWMCTMTLQTRAESMIDSGDINKTIADAGSFRAYTGPVHRKVAGIAPPQIMGQLFSVYGDRLSLLASKLPSALTFASENYIVQLACDQTYRNPLTNELKHDYKCDVGVFRN